MIFCRGCGKQMHHSALSCPHCGAPQQQVTQVREEKSSNWAIGSFVSAILLILAAMTEPTGTWSSDAVVGGIVLGIVPVGLGAIALSKKQDGQWMAITGLILGVFIVLVAIGSSS